MKREEFSAKLHQELSQVHVTPALRYRTLSALEGKEKPIMKKKISIALVFALVTMLLGTVALAAAAGHWGLLDFIGRRSDTWLPDNAETYFTNEVFIAETDAGEFTLREVYYDGYRAHLTMDLIPKDDKTLLVYNMYSMDDVVGNLFHYDLEQDEKDRRTIAQYFTDSGYSGLWLAGVYPTAADDYAADAILHEDGTLTFYLWGAYEEHQPEREMTVELSLCHFDSPEQYDYAQYAAKRTTITMPLTLTAHPDASCETYISTAPQEYPEVGVRVDRLIIEVMPLDIYTTIEFTVIDQAAYDRLDGGLWFEFIDPASTETVYSYQRLKGGLSGGGSIAEELDGTFFIQHETLGANELRDEYTLRPYSAWTKDRYEARTFVMREATEADLTTK